MKNKNNLSPETIIAVAGKYNELTSDIYKALNALKTLMEKPAFTEAYNILETEDPAYEEAAFAVEEANMNGEFSSFIQDLAEGWARE